MAVAADAPDRMNVRLVGHSDLNGAGKGGEGLALKKYGSKKIVFLAHESSPLCFSVIDVTNSAKPVVLKQLPVEADFVRCNSLALNGNNLVVARQTLEQGQPHGGITVYDVSNPSDPKLLSYFDLTGPKSRGTHYVTFPEGHYAYLSTGAKDFASKHPRDDQFLMIVDLQDPKNPKETGRWWLPGTKTTDAEDAPAIVKYVDNGARLHTPLVSNERPDRIYLAYIDGGIAILDIADKSKPKLVSHISWQSLDTGYAHTAAPLYDRGLLILSQESTLEKCGDWPRVVTLVDISKETRPYPVSTLPPPTNMAKACKGNYRFGSHNINQNQVPGGSRVLKNTVVAAEFAGGLRIYSIKDPHAPKEIGYYAVNVPGNTDGAIEMNDMIVGFDGLIYANDRFTGGLFILEYTGKTTLD
jgi:hypothetical protein